MARAKAWALRCKLELQQHPTAVFTTLTYDDRRLPLTLEKRDLQLFLKRLRRTTDRTLRFFASGEYGEKTHRPHYHALLFGLAEADANTIETSWGYGHAHTTNVTPERVAYTAGYTSKKIGFKNREQQEHVDPDTGEVYKWQEPFIQMSRRPGIGGHARTWANSWRLYAINDGHKMAVPRFYHEAWKQQATEEQKEELLLEKAQLSRYHEPEELHAAERHAIKLQELRAERRNY